MTALCGVTIGVTLALIGAEARSIDALAAVVAIHLAPTTIRKTVVGAVAVSWTASCSFLEAISPVAQWIRFVTAESAATTAATVTVFLTIDGANFTGFFAGVGDTVTVALVPAGTGFAVKVIATAHRTETVAVGSAAKARCIG